MRWISGKLSEDLRRAIWNLWMVLFGQFERLRFRLDAERRTTFALLTSVGVNLGDTIRHHVIQIRLSWRRRSGRCLQVSSE